MGIVGLEFCGGGDWWLELLGFWVCEFCLEVMYVEDWVIGLGLGFFKGVVELIIIDGGGFVVGRVEVLLVFGIGFLCMILLIINVK